METACQGCQELTLRSALSDPLIRTVMAADNVDPGELERMLRRIADTIPPHPDPIIDDRHRRPIAQA